jgi:hypothetical protein
LPLYNIFNDKFAGKAAWKEKWDSDRVKYAVQAIRNKKMGGFKAAKICNAPQQLQKVTLKN